MRGLGGILSLCALSWMGCGVSKSDHLKELDQQAQRYQSELTKANQQIEKRDALVQGLEAEIQKTGGDLARIRQELGSRTTELASAKTQLAATQEEIEQLRRLRAQAEAERAQFKALTERFREMIDAGKLEVVQRDGRMMLKLPDEILFPSGSKRLKRGGVDALKEVAKVLTEVGGDREYLVAGHTDNVPIRRGARFANNWELSTARANTVVQLMINQGVPPEQLAAAGYGPYDPIATNDTPEGRQLNRRLEIILMPNLVPIL